ncbi:DUF4439 domain-containing protein, partial [Streptomyces sp. 8P21H-1]|uniref:DUF4439 domain-containing protein n=1 Tax=Streptomyces sp. 8P21H-1 TaxID=2737048 RepID=UPI00156DE054|nr:DUF4439 domain-containing protein [Streptomyces sp. 8P21H-1]
MSGSGGAGAAERVRAARAGASAELTAAQAALGAEHAAVYGYGVVGGRVREDRRAEARAAH